jgi:hypothetical protein
MPNPLRDLTTLILQARRAPEGAMRETVERALGERYPKSVLKETQIRDAYALARKT